MFFWISLLCFFVVILAVVMEFLGILKNIKMLIIIAPLFVIMAGFIMLQIIYYHSVQPVPYHLLPKIGYYAESGWNMLIGSLTIVEAILTVILSLIDMCGGIKRKPKHIEDETFGDTKEFDLEAIFHE